jgi:hypothetical protein
MSRGVIEAWNEHQQKTMPMLFSLAIGAALKATRVALRCQ